MFTPSLFYFLEHSAYKHKPIPETTKVDENKERLSQLKTEVQQLVDARAKMAQVMVDKIFSFAELGFQEVETSKYITDILKKRRIHNRIRHLWGAYCLVGKMGFW